jgi:hypothetical protein
VGDGKRGKRLGILRGKNELLDKEEEKKAKREVIAQVILQSLRRQKEK